MMRAAWTALILFALLPWSAAGDCPLFVLRREDRSVRLDKLTLKQGETRDFASSVESGLIEVILPPALGRSAALVRLAERRRLSVGCGRDGLSLLHSPDRPSRALSELAAQNIRVNVVSADTRRAFLITGYESHRPDPGPITNMFEGRLPFVLGDDDYIVETDTYLTKPGVSITTDVPLELDRWPFVRLKLGDGPLLPFLVDVGAVTTAVSRAALPEGVTIDRTTVVEYSSRGRRDLKYAPGGATGAVQTALGHAVVPVTLGSARIPTATVTVLEEIPDMFGRSVAGILGLDVLRRCDRLVLDLGDPGRLRMETGSSPTQTVAGTPFALVSQHLVLPGLINGHPADLILDTGSPGLLVDGSAVERAGVVVESEARPARGLDRGSTRTQVGRVEELRIGSQSYSDVPCRIASLPIFDQFRSQHAEIALLGNGVLDDLGRLEIDFRAGVVRLLTPDED